MLYTCEHIKHASVDALNKVSPGFTLAKSALYTCLMDVSNFINVLLLFLFTEQLKNTFAVEIEFKIVYKPEYEDLEHPTTKTLVKRIEDPVSSFSRLIVARAYYFACHMN